MAKTKVLIVEDEKDIRELIHFHLYRKEYEVIEAADGATALKMAREHKPSLVLLDIMIPEIDGLEVCKQLKSDKSTEHLKIIFLSAKGEEEDIVKGLELGGDDYIPKPFSPKILTARVGAVLRRGLEEAPHTLNRSGIEIDDAKKKVLVEGNNVNLSMTEFQLLHLFMSRPGHVYTRGQIVDSIKGHNHAVTDRSVDTQLVSLRKKLGEKGKLIETVWGVGYRFKEDEV